MSFIYSFFSSESSFSYLPVLRELDFQRFQLNPQLRKNLYRNTEEHMLSWEFINNQSKLSRNHTYLYFFPILLFQYFSKCWSQANELILDSQISYSPKSKKHNSIILSSPLLTLQFFVFFYFSPLYIFLWTLFFHRAFVLTLICPWNVVPLELYD